MKKSTQLKQRKAKPLQQVRVMGINRVKGPYIYTIFALKFVTLCAPKNSSFEANRARMKKTIRGDEHLNFSDKLLERRRIIRMHS